MSKVLRQYTISGGFSKHASVTDFSANIAHKPLRYGRGSVCNGFLMWCFFLGCCRRSNLILGLVHTPKMWCCFFTIAPVLQYFEWTSCTFGDGVSSNSSLNLSQSWSVRFTHFVNSLVCSNHNHSYSHFSVPNSS